MIIVVKLKKIIFILFAIILVCSAIGIASVSMISISTMKNVNVSNSKYIKWVDFSIPHPIMKKALDLDIKSRNSAVKLNWIELLSYLAAKYGGNFKSYKQKDLDTLVERLNQGEKMQDIAGTMKNYNYFLEAYTAVLKEFVGDYKIKVKSDTAEEYVWKPMYGLKAFSPLAKGYHFSHCNDFGNQRSFGFHRKHLGNDLMGSVGTPVIAVESGFVEAIGWNMYGGWRIGIRSFDNKRYYYYAHLKKDHPYHSDLYEGKIVKAGDVIGYLGMTGYSRKENVNNIETPHLHFGLQLIFDKSQKDGINQIWIDLYDIVELLEKNKSQVMRSGDSKDVDRVNDIEDISVPD